MQSEWDDGPELIFDVEKKRRKIGRLSSRLPERTVRDMTQDLKRIIGLRIRARRLALELTQEQVAEAIIRTVETVSNIERGKAFPGLETLEQLCQVLDTPISSLFNDSKAMESSRQRTELRARLLAIADALSDNDLEIAVRQVEVLAQGRNRRI